MATVHSKFYKWWMRGFTILMIIWVIFMIAIQVDMAIMRAEMKGIREGRAQVVCP